MAKGNKRPKSDNDIAELKRYKLECQKLRKQVSSLRKQLSRVDLDNYSNIKELLESHDKIDTKFEEDNIVRKAEQKWKCHKCNIDSLRIFVLDRPDGTFYFRKCPNCTHKTRLKKLNSIIEGLNTNGEIVKYFNR